MEAAQVTVRRVGIGLAAVAALLTSACAAGQQAQTATEKSTLDGTYAKIGNITLGGLSLVSPAAGNWPKGSDAPVRVVIANDGQQPDTLTSITSPSIAGWQVSGSAAAARVSAAAGATATPSGSSTSVTVPAGKRVSFGVPEAKGTLRLTGLKQTLYPGSSISMTFTFRRAGTVTTDVPVQLSAIPQQSIIPGPSATGQEG